MEQILLSLPNVTQSLTTNAIMFALWVMRKMM